MLEILDCTLRDGGHAIKGSFSAEATVSIIEGLLNAGVKVIEFGRASGIGSPKGDVTDEEYFKATRHLFGKAELGMFCRPDFFGDEQFRQVSEYRPDFLRVGTNASKVEPSEKTISRIRETGAKVRYSLIQAHAVTPKVLADNAKKVEGYGAQTITIMDSTGNMMPSRVKEYVSALVDALSVPVGFHCHDNLGLSIANALAAVEAGATSLDGAICGLARSAGNAATEVLCAVLEKRGMETGVDFYKLLQYIDDKMFKLVPDLKCVPPVDIVFGYAGFHSRNLGMAKDFAASQGVDLYRLIVKVMEYGEANPDEVLFQKAADALKN